MFWNKKKPEGLDFKLDYEPLLKVPPMLFGKYHFADFEDANRDFSSHDRIYSYSDVRHRVREGEELFRAWSEADALGLIKRLDALVDALRAAIANEIRDLCHDQAEAIWLVEETATDKAKGDIAPNPTSPEAEQ